jgi:hypothetical protein
MSDQKVHLKPSAASTADSEKTAAVSKAPSVMDYEKTDASLAPSAREPSAEPHTAPGTANSKERTVVEEAGEEAEEDDDDEDYPKAWRLTVITVALCLSVFCMALVCTSHAMVSTPADRLDRTTPSLQLLFLASQINSRR